ncbi:P1 family peptidase [Micromonospora endophytica]|uniref:6-aminohexanoate hydrolase n=1 Tax=Micromonospora endophytica TaxID=515350 RepID=A0A2W2CGP5_9ACTN|nr:P1 family peptidase [Micromonospora endophytica]PZF97712.1 6-aminohexanoate hydrolase [Micromonospora endophytica]RIW50307.1 6-aminohexanoate hydrolase [Micromonospora endophytica]BCJ57907.1 peptidase S58 [Micromonospora endophytica]
MSQQFPAPPRTTLPFGNDHQHRSAVLGTAGDGWVDFDLPGVGIGTAEYPDGPTGVTVLSVPGGARTAVDKRGGAVGVSGGFPYHHALCFAGGSSFGLAAASGVYDELLRRTGYATDFGSLPVVSGAVVYDFTPRDNAVYPDAALGADGLRAVRTDRVAVGRVGAAVSATVGKVDNARAEWGGQGAAFARIGAARLLVLTVVNAMGVIVDRAGGIVRGNLDPATGLRRHPAEDYAELLTAATPDLAPAGGNTTLTAVVTNVRMTDTELAQFATQVHSSMHRAIQPFHTIADGDTLFALTTDEVTVPAPSLRLGTVAAELAWDAVLSSVRGT